MEHPNYLCRSTGQSLCNRTALLLSILLLSVGMVSGVERIFTVKGEILKLNSANESVVVDHEEIPGFMPAMTMPFKVEPVSAMDALKEGDVVVFEFVVGEDRSFARDFYVMQRPTSGSTEATSSPKQRSANVEIIREGDSVPEFDLTNQDGATVALQDSERYTVLTFIFTRCPVPDFCPLMVKNFIKLRALAAEDPQLEENLRLLSVTLDPEFDTPEVLKAYGESHEVSFDHWDFTWLPTEELDKLTKAFRVYNEYNGVTLDHSLVTALISPRGQVLSIWRGNRWKPEQIADTLATAL